MGRRLQFTVAGTVLALILATPLPAAADVIQCATPADPACRVVGEFFWTRDDFFGDIFGLNNLSGPTAIAGVFSAVNAAVTTGDGSGADVPLFGDPVAPGSTAESFDTLFDVTTAVLTFLFHGTSFAVSLTSADLVSDGTTSFASTLVYAQPQVNAVPEPSTLALLALAGVARLCRRSRTPKPPLPAGS